MSKYNLIVMLQYRARYVRMDGGLGDSIWGIAAHYIMLSLKAPIKTTRNTQSYFPYTTIAKGRGSRAGTPSAGSANKMPLEAPPSKFRAMSKSKSDSVR